MYGITLILVLAVVGGVIAFIGDRLGTRIGKRRLSIFGLRPRHTAVVVTVFTGVCITTVTFGVMAAVSENVRTALFGMERLNRMMAETQAALTRTADALTQAQSDQERAQGEAVGGRDCAARGRTPRAHRGIGATVGGQPPSCVGKRGADLAQWAAQRGK